MWGCRSATQMPAFALLDFWYSPQKLWQFFGYSNRVFSTLYTTPQGFRLSENVFLMIYKVSPEVVFN